MSDVLLQINKKSLPGQLLQQAGLPLPTRLARYNGPWPEQPLADRIVTVGGKGQLHSLLSKILPAAGAEIHTLAAFGEYHQASQAWARPVTELSGDFAHDTYRTDALVFDATGLTTVADLEKAYEFMHLYIRKLRPNGRILVLARPAPSALISLNGAAGHPGKGVASWESAAVSQGLTGFIKGIAKEIGGKGSVANILYVTDDVDEPRLAGPVRFFLSEACAFVTAQPLLVSSALQTDATFKGSRVLEGKNVLLTGAGRGIGAVTAEVLRREGANLIALDHPSGRESLARVVDRIGGKMFLQDIAQEDAAQSIIDYVKTNFDGKLHAVVHNAGVTRDKTLGKMDRSRWNQCIDINLRSVVEITNKIVPEVMQGGGRIVVTASISGIAGNFGQTNYGAAKAGLIGFVHSAAAELAAKGISINAIAPGFIETAMTGAIPFATREGGRRLSALGQGGLPEDVGQVATFLSSDASIGVTGQVLRVCGANFLGA